VSAKGTTNALKLEQTHCTLGNIEVLINSQAVRLLIKKSNTILLARAPNWKIVWFRNDTKLAFEMALGLWLKDGSELVPIGNLSQRPFLRKGVTNMNGESVVDLHSDEGDKVLDYWVLEDASVAAQACDVIRGFYRLPPAKGVPYGLKLTYRKHDADVKTPVSWTRNTALFEKEEGTRLATTKISHVTVPSTEFDYPLNYKVVKNEQQIWLTSGARAAIDDLLNMPTLEYKK
jgi:hypothetical protein